MTKRIRKNPQIENKINESKREMRTKKCLCSLHSVFSFLFKMASLPQYKVQLKWNKQDLIFDLQGTQTLSELKSLIFEQTRILPDRQKLMGLKLKGAGPITNTTTIDELNLASKIMLMGTPEELITEFNASKPVQPDLSEGQEEEQQDTTWIEDPDTVPLEKREEVRTKLERRIQTYQGKILNEPRPGKKLLVLDIDYTLFDHRSSAETGAELMRPYLHEFLSTVYEHYDIGIWSATSMKWIESKMKLLGVEGISQGRTANPQYNYKIVFYMWVSSVSIFFPFDPFLSLPGIPVR